MRQTSIQIAVLGQGYVGLPLSVEFGRKFRTIGFDINEDRISELRSGVDSTNEVSIEDLKASKGLSFSSTVSDIADCNVYIVAVPTPVDASRRPNLGPLLSATEVVACVLKKGDYVIYESTVFPGATEEVCVPKLEELTGLKLNDSFYVGYSPERINPGDKNRPITSIRKVTSGSTPDAARFIDDLYGAIIAAGTYPAASIRVAEAAKVIENTQRDVNIALMNELSIVFSYLNIDTQDVLNAAATKWNFIRLEPGLVGGHCIGVDPYYLIHRASVAGHIPDIIRRAREINDGMARHAARILIKVMTSKGKKISGGRVLILGATFKEDCPDTRNSKVVDLHSAIAEWGAQVEIHDPWANPKEFKEEYGLDVCNYVPGIGEYDAVVLAVKHREYINWGVQYIRSLLSENGVFFDMKSVFLKSDSDLRL